MVKSPVLSRAEKHIAMDKKLLMHYNKSRTPPFIVEKTAAIKGIFYGKKNNMKKKYLN